MTHSVATTTTNNRPLLVTLILVALVALLGLGYVLTQQQVTVFADGQVIALRSHETDVAGLLDSAGVELLPGDVVEPQPHASLQDGMAITVTRAKMVTVDIDGRVMTRRTHAGTLAGLFAELGVSLALEDQVYADGVLLPSSALVGGSSGDTENVPGDRVSSLPDRIVVRRSAPIMVDDDGVQLTIHTIESTVGRALQAAGLTLYLGDDVRPPLHTQVAPGLQVTIRRSVPVSVVLDGQTIHTRTHRGTVGDLLAELGVALIGQDYALPGLNDSLEPNTTIRVVRVLEEMITEQEPIPYETAWQPDPELEIDHRRVAQEGVPGVLQRRIRVRYEDGQEVSRVLEDEWVAKEPANHIVAYGAMIVVRTLDTPTGPVEYWRKLRVLATSYTAATSGKSRDHPAYGITAVGLAMRKGIVAVDPRIVNLYQEVYVPRYGRGLAADTGGAIKGRRIDLGYDEENLVLWYEWVDLYLLTPAPDPSKIRYVIGE